MPKLRPDLQRPRESDIRKRDRERRPGEYGETDARLADHVLTVASEHTGRELIDKGDRTGKIYAEDAFRSGIKNENQFFADFGAFLFRRTFGP